MCLFLNSNGAFNRHLTTRETSTFNGISIAVQHYLFALTHPTIALFYIFYKVDENRQHRRNTRK